jgi:hypothetical protein
MATPATENPSFGDAQDRPLSATDARRPSSVADHPSVIGPWSVVRPSLEYQHAFDLCAVEAHRAGGPVTIYASSPFYAREILKRLSSLPAALAPTGDWASLSSSMEEKLGPEVPGPNITAAEAMERPASVAIWAEPEPDTAAYLRQSVLRSLEREGRLCIINSGWLARRLPEWTRLEGRPASRPVALRQVRRWLQSSAFTIEATVGFHGPLSILWGYRHHLAQRLGRPDVADRCHFKMRAEYVTRGWRAAFSPVCVIIARKL